MATKYIAFGFFNDAEKLLHEFSLEESVDFPVFAEIWKKHNFALVFLGRDKYQITPFTNEIFLITLGFLENPLFYYQVGVFFLLYALYRHQLSDPPILIRITTSQFQVFSTIWNTAIEKKLKSLHYIMEYLYKTSFDFVASATLYGPRSLKYPQDFDQHSFTSLCLMRETKANMILFQKSNVLQNLKELSLKYEKMKEKVYSSADNNPSGKYDQYISSLDNLINDRPLTFGPRGSYNQSEPSIGSRRAYIKAKAFKNKANEYQPSDTSDSESVKKETEYVYAVAKKKKKIGKRLGRPKRVPSDDDKDYVPDKYLPSDTSDRESVKKETGNIFAVAKRNKKKEKIIRKRPGRPRLVPSDDDEHYVPQYKTKSRKGHRKGVVKKCSVLDEFEEKPTVKDIKFSKIEIETDESS